MENSFIIEEISNRDRMLKKYHIIHKGEYVKEYSEFVFMVKQFVLTIIIYFITNLCCLSLINDISIAFFIALILTIFIQYITIFKIKNIYTTYDRELVLNHIKKIMIENGYRKIKQ